MVPSLRQTVRHKKEHVWVLRDDQDIYTGNSRELVELEKCEIDHIIPLSWIDNAWETVAGQYQADDDVRQFVQGVVNSIRNLNVTTHTINQARKGPYGKYLRKWKAARGECETVECYMRTSKTQSVRALVDDGIANRMKEAVIETWDDRQKALRGLLEVDSEARNVTRRRFGAANDLADELDQLVVSAFD